MFPDTVVPRDFDVIEIPFAERGEPVLVPRGARRSRGPATPSSPRSERAPTHRTSAPAPASTTRCGRPTPPGGSAFAALVELGDLRGRRVLDVGCGTGRLARRARQRGAREGVGHRRERRDGRRRARDAARRRRRPARQAERLPFRDGWFDRVTMSLVLHLVDRPRALAEARRVVPDDGRIAISTFHPDHFETYWLQPFFPSIKSDRRARDSRRPTRWSESWPRPGSRGSRCAG